MNKTLDEMMQELVAKHGASECAVAFYEALQARMLELEHTESGRWSTPGQDERRQYLKALKPEIEG